MIIITHLESAPRVPFNLDGRIMYTAAKIELVHVTLNPGEKISLHTNPFEVIFYPLEGELCLLVENQSIDIKPFSCISIPAGIHRGLENKHSSKAQVLAIKIFSGA